MEITVLYNVKMRSEKERRHVSGAERIVPWVDVDEALRALVKRAEEHPGGEPDSITLTISRLQKDIMTLPALPVVEPVIRNQEEAKAFLSGILERLGLPCDEILSVFYALRNMRGAALLEVPALKRLDPDTARGVRVTALDYEGRRGSGKNHFKEALCLASKVAHCPCVIGELCMSDDPEYTTGYFASKTHGYIRIPHIRKKGDAHGGRIFLFKGSANEARACMEYFEQQPVVVTGIP